jgi:hypothetical protein
MMVLPAAAVVGAAAIRMAIFASVFPTILTTVFTTRRFVGLAGHGSRREQCAGHEQGAKQL